ncbi:unnamed protein product, partial [Symbiodinium microadriaticum]
VGEGSCLSRRPGPGRARAEPGGRAPVQDNRAEERPGAGGDAGAGFFEGVSCSA